MMIQMHNERSNAINLDQDLEVVEMESRERNERNCKEESEKHISRFHIVMPNETAWVLVAAHKGIVKSNFA